MMNWSSHFTTNTRHVSLFFLSIILGISFFLFTKQISAQSTTPQLSFSPSTIQTTVGSPTTVEVLMETGGQQVGGVGAKMRFDPSIIEIQTIETLPIFPDYPTSSFDNELGTITISGVVQNVSQLITTSGPFARITFKLKQPQTTTIDFIFEPNQTTDSNIAIMSGTGDALQQVTPLSITSIESTSSNDMIAVPMESEIVERPMSPELYVTASPNPEITSSTSSINIPLLGLGIILFAITIGLHLHVSIELKQIHEEINHLKKKL